MTGRTILMVVAIVSTGLMAGLWFGWLVSVIPGTGRTEDRTYVQTMQQINLAIINPAFIIPFILTPVLLAAAAVAEYRAGNQRRGATLGAAAIVTLLGVIGVTAGGNVPLNNTLADVDLASLTDAEAAKARTDYEGPWNRWHAVRTVASIIALVLAASAPLINAEDG